MRRLPDRIRLARISQPAPWLRMVNGAELESVVELATQTDGVIFNPWPTKEIDVTGYEWTARTWLGWTMVLMWEE